MIKDVLIHRKYRMQAKMHVEKTSMYINRRSNQKANILIGVFM